VTDNLDGGEIIAQEKVLIEKDDTPESLSKKVLKIEHRIYPESIKSILNKA
jgi:phosphoribosylglycinamide formyltransferase-1